MSDDLKRKKSDYLLELALEEQLENDGEMQAYQSGNERPHEFSDEHNRKIKIAENVFRLLPASSLSCLSAL